MSAFQERMKKLASDLSPEAIKIVKKVIAAEHANRFVNRDRLPDEFATAALHIAKRKETAS